MIKLGEMELLQKLTHWAIILSPRNFMTHSSSLRFHRVILDTSFSRFHDQSCFSHHPVVHWRWIAISVLPHAVGTMWCGGCEDQGAMMSKEMRTSCVLLPLSDYYLLLARGGHWGDAMTGVCSTEEAGVFNYVVVRILSFYVVHIVLRS